MQVLVLRPAPGLHLCLRRARQQDILQGLLRENKVWHVFFPVWKLQVSKCGLFIQGQLQAPLPRWGQHRDMDHSGKENNVLVKN